MNIKIFMTVLVSMIWVSTFAGNWSNKYSIRDEITIKLYGTGGIIVQPDGTQKVCPNQASVTCAEITVNTNAVQNGSISNALGVLLFQNANYNITIISCTNIIGSPNNYNTNGANMIYRNR